MRGSKAAEAPYDWTDFEPTTPVQAIAWALMAAGLAYEEQPESGLVRLDYSAAERVVDALEQIDFDVRERSA